MSDLSSKAKCDQIYKYQRYDFGYTLLCYLSTTFMFNEPASVQYTLTSRLNSYYATATEEINETVKPRVGVEPHDW